MPPSLSISAHGRGEEHFSSVKLCFQNMDERLAGRIVLKYHSSCWFSLFLLLVFHSPVISAGNNSFRFWNQKFLLLIRWIHKAEIILRLCIYSQVYFTFWIMPFISESLISFAVDAYFKNSPHILYRKIQRIGKLKRLFVGRLYKFSRCNSILISLLKVSAFKTALHHIFPKFLL